MGEIRRYGKAYYARDIIQQHGRGEYVLYTDYVAECDRLRAEVERLKERNNVLSNENDCIKNDWNVLQAEHMTLQEEFKLLNDRHNLLLAEAAGCISTTGGKGMGKIIRYHPAKTCCSEMNTRPDGYWVRYIDHVAECDRLRAEVERLRKAIQLAEYQHLGCGGNLTPRETVKAMRRILCGALENPPPTVPNFEVEARPEPEDEA